MWEKRDNNLYKPNMEYGNICWSDLVASLLILKMDDESRLQIWKKVVMFDARGKWEWVHAKKWLRKQKIQET